MAETEEKDDAKAGRNPYLWKPGEVLPWAKFEWAAWLSNPALRRMTPDQRGRFMDVWAATHGTKTPGVMTEDDARGWAGYSVVEWKANRETFARVFNTTRTKGRWRLEDVIESWKASQIVARRNYDRAMKGVEARVRKSASGNGLTTTSRTPSATPSGTPSATPGRTDVETLRLEERTDVPDLAARDLGRSGLAALASGGTTAGPEALLERALRAGCADGTGETGPRSRGGP